MTAQGDAKQVSTSGSSFPQSLALVYERYFDFVWRNARRLGVPEASADDVAQRVFMVVQRRLSDYDGRSSMQAWIFGIMVQVVSDHRRSFLRGGTRHEPSDLQRAKCAGTQPVPREQLEHEQRGRMVGRLLGELDEEKRMLLILSELEEWTMPEIAEFFGSTIDTIRSRLHAAKCDFELAYQRSHNAGKELP